MSVYCFRLRRGSDLLLSIEKFAKEKEIKAGVVLSGVGCVSRAKVRDASGVTIKEINEPLEIVSLMGTVSEERTHLHISFSKEDLSTIGGHLTEGCIINTTCEIAIQEIDGIAFGTEFDEETGYDELVIKNIGQNKIINL